MPTPPHNPYPYPCPLILVSLREAAAALGLGETCITRRLAKLEAVERREVPHQWRYRRCGRSGRVRPVRVWWLPALASAMRRAAPVPREKAAAAGKAGAA